MPPYSVNCVDLLFRPVCYSSYEIPLSSITVIAVFDLFRIFSLEHMDMDNVGFANFQKHSICYMYLLLWLEKPHFAHVVRRPMGGFCNFQNKQQLFENCPVVMKTNYAVD